MDKQMKKQTNGQTDNTVSRVTFYIENKVEDFSLSIFSHICFWQQIFGINDVQFIAKTQDNCTAKHSLAVQNAAASKIIKY